MTTCSHSWVVTMSIEVTSVSICRSLSLFICLTRVIYIYIYVHIHIHNKIYAIYISYMWKFRLILSGPCCNWYFPDDDGDEGTHSPGLQSQQAALSTPELSINCHGAGLRHWLRPVMSSVALPNQNWLSGPSVLIAYYIHIRTLTNDTSPLWLPTLTASPPIFALHWLLCVCQTLAWSYRTKLRCLKSFFFNHFKCSAEDETLILWKGAYTVK